MCRRQAYIILAFLAAACFADVSKPNSIQVDIMAPTIADAPVTFAAKNQTDVRADKKAMIDFSSEFSENGNDGSDDLLEEDQSEMALEKEEADYDDSEIEDQMLEDDNDIEDLSGGATIQPRGDELSFDDEEDADEQSYDDYDSDEDSAADDDNDDGDSNANFTEADDEQVMSDISNINDYKDDDSSEGEEGGLGDGEEEGLGDGEEESGNENDTDDDACKRAFLISTLFTSPPSSVYFAFIMIVVMTLLPALLVDEGDRR